ncbi:MAG: hypothetical protein MN733_38010, partial [Nitrososphaera sp.]|nr:hypothetical protein [Nitrososphaera sp.]
MAKHSQGPKTAKASEDWGIAVVVNPKDIEKYEKTIRSQGRRVKFLRTLCVATLVLNALGWGSSVWHANQLFDIQDKLDACQK